MKELSQNIVSNRLILFQRMKELADRQENLLEENRIDAFMSLLTQRSFIQQKIDKQDELALETGSGSTDHLFGAERSEVVLQLEEVIRSIQETDRKIEEIMLKQKNDVISEIKGLRHSKKAVKGYGGRPGLPPIYIDRHK